MVTIVYYTGDYVYLRSDEQQSFIARIEKMWTDEKYYCIVCWSVCVVCVCVAA